MSNVLQKIKTNSKDIAREALRALVLRKLDPTPDNYRRLYDEIAGIETPSDDAAEVALNRIINDFPRSSGEPLRMAKALERAQAKRDWALCATVFQEVWTSLSQYHQSADSWRALLAELVRQLDAGHKGITRARKKERLERVLEMHAASPDQLQHKLGAIVRSWSELQNEAVGVEAADAEMPVAQNDPVMGAPAAPVTAREAADDSSHLCELLAHVLEVGMAGLLAYEPALSSEAGVLARQARAAHSQPEVAALKAAMKAFLLKIELTAANNAELHQGMMRLLRLVIENVAELVGDDDWLSGQISTLAEIISQPLDLVMIEHAERNIRDAITRQSTLRHGLTEAKTAFKSMVSGFVNRLGEFSNSTGEYHDKIETLSTKIRAADDITTLGQLLDEVAVATKNVQAAAQRSREETLQTQREVQAAEDKIRLLQTELARVSAKVREDQLTGALNRRGLEEEYERARAASERRTEPMCVALLDIDNFKSLNDTHGHQAGDGALVHLARVIKSTVRPTDVVCRYGGEEFVILLPGTGLNDAVAVVSRLQRELTKRFFLHDNQRLLLTFSAGVAERRTQESRDDAIGRADAAMYTAKRTGKNRVIGAN